MNRLLSNNHGLPTITSCFSVSVEKVTMKRFLLASLKDAALCNLQILPIVVWIVSLLILQSMQILPTRLRHSLMCSSSETTSPIVIQICSSSDKLKCPQHSSIILMPSIKDWVILSSIWEQIKRDFSAPPAVWMKNVKEDYASPLYLREKRRGKVIPII